MSSTQEMSEWEKSYIENILEAMRNGVDVVNIAGEAPVSDAFAIKLAENLPSSKLTELNLTGNQITDAGAIKLAEMLPSSKLTGLGLGDNQITDAGKKVLSKRKWLGLSSKIKNKDGQKIGICI